MKIQIVLRLGLLCLVLVLPACATDFPSRYSAEPIEATVIDADTKQPLEGVIVTANWQLESGNPGGSFVVGQMMVMEAVTNKDGVFHFPAWGPIRRKEGLLLDKDPQLLFFKSDYVYRSLSNYGRTLEGIWKDPVRTSKWDGKTIELRRFTGKPEELAKNVYWLSRDIDSILDLARGSPDCNWKKVPRMLVALHAVSVEFDRQAIKPYGGLDRIKDIPDSWRCGSPKEFFKGYLQ